MPVLLQFLGNFLAEKLLMFGIQVKSGKLTMASGDIHAEKRYTYT